MPFYHKLGKIPHKRHTVFSKPKGGYIMSNCLGQSVLTVCPLYYIILTDRQWLIDIIGAKDISPKIAVDKNLKSLSFKGFNVKPTPDYLESRVAVLINNDCHISLSAPQQSMTDYFYKNADCDEMIFVHKGTGTLRTIVGNLKYGPGDYLMIPRGMIYAFKFDTEDNRLFIVESTTQCIRQSVTATGLVSC